VLISQDKLLKYLLIHREQDDKSKFLAQAGFTEDNPHELETSLRNLITIVDAEEDDNNQYGTFYLVKGHIRGINERELAVVTVWLKEMATDEFRFITLKPWRKV
jgi:hypothetical protein